MPEKKQTTQHPTPASLLRRLMEASDLPGLVEAAIGEARSAGISGALLGLEPSGTALRLLATAGPLGNRLAELTGDTQRFLCDWALRNNAAAVYSNPEQDYILWTLAEQGLVGGQTVCVPIHFEARPWGVLVLYCSAAAGESQPDLAWLKSLAELTGLALEHFAHRQHSRRQAEQLAALQDLSTLLVSALDPQVILTFIVDMAVNHFGLDLCCALLPAPDGTLRIGAARGLDPARAKLIVLPINQPPDLQAFQAPGLTRLSALPIAGRQTQAGYMVLGRRGGSITEEDTRILAGWCGLLSLVLDQRRLVAQAAAGEEAALATLIRVMASRPGADEKRRRSLADLATATARNMGLDDGEVRRVELAAVLQHIGHLAPPPAPDRISVAVAGAQLVSGLKWLEPAAPLLRHQYENWDGTGGPDHLEGEQIPLGARILRACETYVDVQAGSTAGAPVHPVAAVLQLTSGAGKELDPKVTAALGVVVWSTLNSTPSDVPAGAGETHSSGRPTSPQQSVAAPPIHPDVDLDALTEREREILWLVAQGLSNKEIADKLVLSEYTVKTHVSHILQKLSVPDRTKAAVYLLRKLYSVS